MAQTVTPARPFTSFARRDATYFMTDGQGDMFIRYLGEIKTDRDWVQIEGKGSSAAIYNRNLAVIGPDSNLAIHTVTDGVNLSGAFITVKLASTVPNFPLRKNRLPILRPLGITLSTSTLCRLNPSDDTFSIPDPSLTDILDISNPSDLIYTLTTSSICSRGIDTSNPICASAPPNARIFGISPFVINADGSYQPSFCASSGPSFNCYDPPKNSPGVGKPAPSPVITNAVSTTNVSPKTTSAGVTKRAVLGFAAFVCLSVLGVVG
ncbi:hypothetical protein BC829DRAFT_406071 [Chytridium lagenaria]|nr:hypothetical protein BC829DRAFT_406071 [Chytridium lagenaria]